MDAGWFIGQERIPSIRPRDHASSSSTLQRPCRTINLTEMLGVDEPCAVKQPVRIRPPVPRAPPAKAKEFNQSHSYEPAPKPIIRQRSHSLPEATPMMKKKQCRNVGVRFVDSLGVDLEDIRVFKAGQDPFIPHHVTFRLLMGAEVADGRHLEISLPYMKPVFSQQPGDHPGFLGRLRDCKVCLERILCFELGVIGITHVINLDFEKDVTARYTFTEWKSCTEAKASWVSTISTTWKDEELSCDTFRFHLPVPPYLQPGAVLQFAIRYKACGAEYWDNNNGQNYKLVCHNYKFPVPKECEDSMVHFL